MLLAKLLKALAGHSRTKTVAPEFGPYATSTKPVSRRPGQSPSIAAAPHAAPPAGYSGTIAAVGNLPKDPALEALYTDQQELDAFLALPPSEQMALIEGELSKLPPHEQRLISEILRKELSRKWIPLPGPQTAAMKTEAFLTLYGGSAGGGKRLCHETVVPVPLATDPSGWKRHGDLSVGDEVYSPDGAPVRIEAVAGHTDAADAFEIEFSTGEVVYADADHLWLTWTEKERMRALRASDEWRAARRARRPSRAVENSQKPWVSMSVAELNRNRVHLIEPACGSVRTTAEICATLTIGSGRVAMNHSIDVSSPLMAPEVDLPVEPYLFGLWIGDGSSQTAGIGMTATDWPEVLSHIEAPYRTYADTRAPRKEPFVTHYFAGLKPLKAMGIMRSGGKRIPAEYLRASIAQRVALLQGICDTDGSCQKAKGLVEVGFSNIELANDLFDLVSSLGIKSRLRAKAAKDQNGRGATHYRILFAAPFPCFRLPRKAEFQKLSGFRPTTNRRYIVAARRVAPRPMKCIKVANDDGLYLVTRSCITTHNTDLILGLALTEHQRTMIVRREYDDLSFITERAIKINGTRTGYAGSPHPVLRTQDGRLIEFRAFQRAGDEQKRQGQPVDLLAIDEAAQFLETQIQFLSGWLRSTDRDETGKTQRRRIVMASNPPLSDEGQWMVRWFAPWLDPHHPNPAKPGELRWYVSDEEGHQKEVDGEGPHQVGQHMVKARSRTFIPAKLQDNSYLMRDDDYVTQLHSLPEPLRSAMRDGNFMAVRSDDAWQVIPSEWIRLAQARWTPRPPPGQAMTCISLDPAGGGKDAAAIAARYGMWFAPVLTEKGTQTADGRFIGARVLMERRNNCQVVVDVGGGYGSEAVTTLKDNEAPVIGFRGSDASMGKSVGSGLEFANLRAETWWRFREALDPISPDPIALPPDAELAADLATPRLNARAMQTRGVIQIESKEDIRDRLGRSPDKGDSVVTCLPYGGLREFERKQTPRLPATAHTGYSQQKKFATSTRR